MAQEKYIHLPPNNSIYKKYIDIDGRELKLKQLTESKIFYNEKDEPHRLDGPAVLNRDGSYVWYRNGKRHRIGGPSKKYNHQPLQWYVDGKFVNPYYICG